MHSARYTEPCRIHSEMWVVWCTQADNIHDTQLVPGETTLQLAGKYSLVHIDVLEKHNFVKNKDHKSSL